MNQRRSGLGCLIAAALLLLLAAACLIGGYKLYQRYKPSAEMADKAELLHIREGQVAILLNSQLQEETGIYEDGRVYLPVSWVAGQVNQRFYWDEGEELLVYALPEKIVYADADTQGEGGPLLKVKDGEAYLSLGLILNYSDVRIETFATSEIKRVFIDTSWEPIERAQVRRGGMVRVKGGVKSPIVTELAKGDGVTVLETMDKWAKVRTEDGFVGYIENRRLGKTESQELHSSFKAPVYESISMDEPVILAFHQVFVQDANKNMEALMEKTEGVNVIVPTWFAVKDEKGGYSSLASKDYVEKAHEMGLQVWAMLNNVSTSENVAVDTLALLSSTSARNRLVEGMMKEAETYGFDGINLDFESLKAETGPHYVQFIRELSAACRKAGLVLSVDNYVPSPYTQFYNRKEQGIVADYVIIMGYDEHYAGGEPGPTASLSYVEEGIKNTLEQVPKEKVINAVPFYSRLWTTKDGKTTSKAYGIEGAKEWMEENGVTAQWKEELGLSYGELENESGLSRIWAEDERSLGLKADLVRKYGIAGIACWKLGFETQEAWEAIGRVKE